MISRCTIKIFQAIQQCIKTNKIVNSIADEGGFSGLLSIVSTFSHSLSHHEGVILFETVFLFSEAGPCPKHSEALVGIRTALWRAPLAFTSMVIADTDEKEPPKNKKKKRATFNLIKKQRKPEPPGGTGDLLWSQWNVVKGKGNFSNWTDNRFGRDT